jgi:drug/metabolite transporter (DMT)-like permease
LITAIAVPKVSRSALLSALVAMLVFGSVPACIRLVALDSIAIGIVRLTLGAIGMAVVMAAQRRSTLREFFAELRREWWVLVAIGLLFGLHWLTYFLSIKWATASIGTLGFSTYGAQLPLLGWLCGFGRPTRAALVGVALAFVGTWLCLPAADGAEAAGPESITTGSYSWSEVWHSGGAIGLAIGVLSGTTYAFLPLLHQRHARMDHEIRTWAQFALALPLFVPLAPWATWSLSWDDVLLILHLGLVVTLIGHLLWVKATTELPIETTSVLSYLQLPVTLAMNWLLVKDQFTASMVAGATLIVAGNALALGWKSRAAEELAEGQ